jgi:hypothetical protein
MLHSLVVSMKSGRSKTGSELRTSDLKLVKVLWINQKNKF